MFFFGLSCSSERITTGILSGGPSSRERASHRRGGSQFFLSTLEICFSAPVPRNCCCFCCCCRWSCGVTTCFYYTCFWVFAWGLTLFALHRDGIGMLGFSIVGVHDGNHPIKRTCDVFHAINAINRKCNRSFSAPVNQILYTLTSLTVSFHVFSSWAF